jgi:hypothetical protein
MRRSRSADHDEPDDEVPLHHQRPFGAGLKRKRVEFVPATEPVDDASATSFAAEKGALAGNLYASIVLGERKAASEPPVPAPADSTAANTADKSIGAPPVCSVCSLPITTSVAKHESSLAHLASLPHSHPPSSLDRRRMGLRALSAQGWDPDSRLGLGRQGEGVRFPIKVAAKEDTLGVGATAPGPAEKAKATQRRPLNAKEMRALAETERKKGQRLQGEIFGRVDVEGYLKGDGRDNEIS